MKPKDDSIRRARGAVNVNALVLAALVIGLLSNVLIATLFGLSRRVDAFFAAAVVPALFMNLCIDYLGKNFLPVLGGAKAVGATFASSVTSSIVTIVTIVASVVTVILVAFSAPLFGALLPGFEPAEIELVCRYFAIMAPSIVLMAVSTFHEYVWQYEERFTYVSLSRMALPAANLISVVLLAPWLGEYCLPVGYLVGHLTLFVLLLHRVPYRYRPELTLRPGFERRIFANSAVVMSTGLLARSKSMVMNYLASMLGGGAISALALASKLAEPLERGAFTGIRMLMFSHTVKLVIARDQRGLGTLYSTGLRAAFLLLAPLIWWIALNSDALVQVLFQRGEFTPEMAALVAPVLSALIPSVLLLGSVQLLSNAFYAMDRVAVPALVMPAGTLVYIAAAVPLSAALGAPGLALATTAAAAAVFAVLIAAVARAVPQIGVLRTGVELSLYALLAGAAMLGAAALLASLDWSPAMGAALSLPLGAAVYVAALHFGGDRTYRALAKLARTYAGRAPTLNAARSNKVPPARKSD